MRRLFLLLVTAAISTNAATIFTAGQNAGTTLDAVDVTGFGTTGNEMGGITITGAFAGGGSAVCTWVNGGGNAGGCTAASGGRGFQLALDGDTFSASWLLTNILGANLLSLTFDGPVGFTVFDRATGLFGLGEGTAGSSLGKDASGSTSSAVGGSATYNNQVATMGNAAVGDLYAQLVIAFDGAGWPRVRRPTGSWTPTILVCAAARRALAYRNRARSG